MAAASGSTPGPPAVWAVTIQPPSAKHIGRGESEVAEPLATRQAPNGRGAARPAPASFLREGPALPSWSGDAAAAGPASPLGSNASPGMRPVASRSTLPNSASGFLQLPPRAGSANSQQARFARRLSDSKPAGGLHGADRELGLSSDCLGFLRFADEIVERAYQSYRADVSFPRHRLLVPLIFFAYFGAAMVFLGVTFSNEDSFREHDRSKRLVKIFVGFVPSLLFGLVNMFLLFRRPSFFKRHMQTLLTAATLFAVAFNAWPVLDFEHPQIIYFSCMWLIDIACRGGYLLSARAHMLVITCIAIVVWIAFPVSGAAHNLVDYLAQAVIAGMVVPASFFAVREDEVRRRSDFARNSSLHDELRAVRVAHDDLRQRNAALRDQLTTLQREKIGADLDLDSPLAKALKALDAIRSDPRLAAQCEWAVAGLEGAITTLIASKSILVPDLGVQVQEGKLRLDSDVSRWLFSEVAPTQKPRGGPTPAGVVSSRPSRRHSGVEGGAASGPEGAGPESPASRPASRSSLATFRSGRQPQPQPQPQPHEAGAGALQRSPSPGRALRAPALGGGRKAGSSFRLVPTLPPPSLVQPEDRRLLLAMAIKACDIGHGAKPLPLHIEWSNRVSSEFYNQGDLERGQGLEVSPLMDRSTANLPRSQMGFFDFICLPSFEALSGILPPLKDVLVAGARRNYAHWQESALKTATP